MLYPGLANDLGPFIIPGKEGITVEDVDGNVYLDLFSAMASVPLGSARPDLTDAAVGLCSGTGMRTRTICAHETCCRWLSG